VREYNENFLQGSLHHLEIYLSKSEQMTADLN
jgi:hypothetical protein